MTEKKLTRRELAAMSAGLAALAAAPAQAAGQPNMEKARAHLESAMIYLERAKANKGGHRKEAIKLTKAALKQVQQGIRFSS